MFLLLLVVLGWYSGWFVGLMFKRQQNESTYGKSVTVIETVFTKRTFVGQHLVKNCHSEVHENPTIGLVANVMWQTDWRPGIVCSNTFLMSIKILQSCSYVTEGSECWRIKVQFISADNITRCRLILKTMRSAEGTLLYLSLSRCQENYLWKSHAGERKPVYVAGWEIDHRQRAENNSDSLHMNV